MEMATISKWYLVHLWGAKYQPFGTYVMMALLFMAPIRRVRDVDMKREFAFVVRSFLFILFSSQLFLVQSIYPLPI